MVRVISAWSSVSIGLVQYFSQREFSWWLQRIFIIFFSLFSHETRLDVTQFFIQHFTRRWVSLRWSVVFFHWSLLSFASTVDRLVCVDLNDVRLCFLELYRHFFWQFSTSSQPIFSVVLIEIHRINKRSKKNKRIVGFFFSLGHFYYWTFN